MPALAESEDPLQWRFEEPDGKQSELRPSSWENDLCQVKLLAMHRPTHDPDRMKEPLFFALELSRFVEISGMTRQAQKALVSACQAVADCYHSNGHGLIAKSFSNLEGVGLRREAQSAAEGGWEVTGGILPGVTMDFDRLCGRPPVYFSVYALREAGAEKRHLQSMKRTFFRISAWSSLHPPDKEGPSQSVTNADFSWDGYGSYDLLDRPHSESI
ncbi:unnamed protein product [Symbiodinium sp. KB8]|nr:unnamed protein product [Symbiodinium sp. KB8]